MLAVVLVSTVRFCLIVLSRPIAVLCQSQLLIEQVHIFDATESN